MPDHSQIFPGSSFWPTTAQPARKSALLGSGSENSSDPLHCVSPQFSPNVAIGAKGQRDLRRIKLIPLRYVPARLPPAGMLPQHDANGGSVVVAADCPAAMGLYP